MNLASISLITTLLLSFSAAISGGVLAHILRLPMFLGYILMGVFFGNLFPTILDKEFLGMAADIGVVLLLFSLGLEFSFHRLRNIVKRVYWATICQILLIIFLVFLLLFFFGWGILPSLFVAAAASLASTAVVIKLLSERGEMETLHGQVLTGWLVVQDLSVIPLMIILPAVSQSFSLGSADPISTVVSIALSIGKSILAVGIVLFLGRFGIPRVLDKVAALKSKEILIITTVGFVLLSGLLMYLFGMSAALGAFIAGLLVAETTEHHAVFSEVRPLRDIFAVLFFVSLGLILPIGDVWRNFGFIFFLTIAILGLKYIISFLLTRLLSYHRKTSFLVSLGLLSLSEFGFVIGKEGLRLEALTQEQYILLIALIFSSIIISAPLLSKGQKLYYDLANLTGGKLKNIFPDKGVESALEKELPFRDHVVICGYGRVGKYVGRALLMAHIPFIVVDFNKETVNSLLSKGIPVIYGDPSDLSVLDAAQVDYAKTVIIAIPDKHSQELIIGNALTLNKHVKIFCRTHHEKDQSDLKTLGATTIIQPEFEASLAIIRKILPEYGIEEEDLSGKISRLKIEHGVG